MAQNRTIRTIFQRTELSEPALFSPSDTTKPVDGFPKLCVSTFSEAMIQAFASLEGTRQIAELYTANGVLPVYRLRYRGTDIAFYLSRVGAPACVSGFEEVVAMGAETFVLFGSCGVLDDEAVKGRIIIPVSAIRDEGTSYHYAPPSPEIEMDPRSIQVLERVLSACGCPYVKGKTWTSDGIYRETVPVIRERREDGCLAVEMECASMIAAARYRGIPFLQFLYGADDLSTQTWAIRDLAQYGVSETEKYMALGFECGLALREAWNE